MAEQRRVRVRRIEQYDDGTTMEYDSEDLPLPANDPYVLERTRDVGPSGAVTGIYTRYAASNVRPPTLPPEFPFLPGREFHTTESPDGMMSTGARWRCEDPDAVVAEAVAASLADGWTYAASPLPSEIPYHPLAALRRGDVTRMFQKFEAHDVRIVQMTDVDGF
jgi:hypothetical protein